MKNLTLNGLTYIAHCSRITRYPSFIAQDFFHFSTLIHNGDNLNMYENLRFHGEFLRKLKKCRYWNFFYEFCIINIKKWIEFLKNRCKYVRILQDLRESFQYSQKYGQKGRCVILFSDVRKNLFYDKSWVFS